MRLRRFLFPSKFVLWTVLLAWGAAAAPGEMLGGRADFSVQDLPAGRLRADLERLPERSRDRAERWLGRFRFPSEDVGFLAVDREGGVYYADHFPPPREQAAEAQAASPVAAEVAVAVSPFPPSLKFHSKPNAPNVLFLDFDGHLVTGTAWNNDLNRDPIPAQAFDTDGNAGTFSDTEQQAIKQIWQRVAEDYAPFDIDVTTEAPAVFDLRTAHCLITRNTDVDNKPNPASTAGGVAYVDVFNLSVYPYYRPGWVYTNNLGNDAKNIAEAASHEIGHNLGLSHDGKTDGTAYYTGHGSGDTSWAPIMGVGYYEQVTQWSKGEYYLANNPEDDLAIIDEKVGFRYDDHSGVPEFASLLAVSGGGNIVATTPEDDTGNGAPANKGVIEHDADVDVFAFVTGAGTIELTVDPWIGPTASRGGNLDLRLRLLDADGALLVESQPVASTGASLLQAVTAGRYYLEVTGVGTGSPLNNPPSGYTPYGSLGQYFISGTIVPNTGPPVPPVAFMTAEDVTAAGQTNQMLRVHYSDDATMDASTLDNTDLIVIGPQGYRQPALLVEASASTDTTPLQGTYAIPPPGPAWTSADRGAYGVVMQPGQVADTEGLFVPPQILGVFTANVPVVLYEADMTVNPSWTLGGDWAYGTPLGLNGDPAAGYNGSSVIGYNLAGYYGKKLDPAYAVTPAIDCSSVDEVRLRFRRWLGMDFSDSATLEVSSNGTDWNPVWSASGTVSDEAWVPVEYDVTSAAAGRSTVFFRWGMASNPDPFVGCGWNLDEVQVLGWPAEVVPPSRSLTVTVPDPVRGSVTPPGGTYPEGSILQLNASPSNYFAFAEWTGDLTGTVSTLALVLEADTAVQANFDEVLTVNQPTPLWWLASYGYTQEVETVVGQAGANGHPLWASFVAGLDPTDADDRFVVLTETMTSEGYVLTWPTREGRVYTVLSMTNGVEGPQPVPGGIGLPWTQTSFTSSVEGIHILQVERVP